MKMYYISSWGFTITEIEVTRKTDRSVWIMHGKRERRESDTYYFETWELAKQAIVERESTDLQHAERRLEQAKEDLARAIAITRD